MKTVNALIVSIFLSWSTAHLSLLAQTAASAELEVEVHDKATNRMTPSRVYLLDDQGTLQVPEGAVSYEKYQEHHFVTRGHFRLALSPGRYRLRVERGPEYRMWSNTVELAAHQHKLQRVELERWIDMNGQGWWSADLHNHRRIEEMPDLLLAEDLNLAPTLSDWIWEEKAISRPPQTEEAVRQVTPHHVYSVLDKEVERLRHGPGAVDLLALQTPIPFDGNWLFPPSDRFCQLAHDQGGYVDAEKILWRDVAALVALGHVDFAGIVHNHFNRHGVEVDTEGWGMIPKYRPEFNTKAGMPLWAMDVYYKFLNCGFRLPVSAGSASGVKAAPLGYNRVYAKLDTSFSYANWFAALKAGRNFATNGPMLFLKVNSREPGDTLRFPRAATLRIEAEALSDVPLDRLEVLFKGQVVKSIRSHDDGKRLKLRLRLTAQESGWVAARCFEPIGTTIRFAHTSPVYVQVGQDKGVVADDARFFLDWIDREMNFYRTEERFRKPEHRTAMLEFFASARNVYEELARSVPERTEAR
ncbi:MAG: CehA/McbA family metallohydrolase [Acidobacteriota bacterium]